MSRINTLSPSHAGTSDGLPSNAPEVPQVPLVGAVGQEYVHNVLSNLRPDIGLREIQRRGAFQDKRYDPLLKLLDHLGLKRVDTHKAVLEAAKARLLALVPKLSPDKLVTLLEVSFAYIGLPQLRDIPLAVLGKLRPVPAAFLKQLATDKELFHELPHNVQQEVWELDRKLLQTHALPLVEGYTWETGTLLRALDMGEFLPSPSTTAEKQLGGPRVARRIQRSGSNTLKKLVAMVGHSLPIYKGIMDLVCVRLRDSEAPYCGVKEAAYCSLRSQLLMALHDVNLNEITSKEPVHKLAWTLDACLKDRVLDDRRLRELSHFMYTFDRQTAAPSTTVRRPPVVKKRTRESSVINDAESIIPGRSANQGAENQRVLADAGMVLRDPSTLHLIIHHVLRKLEGLVENEMAPSDDMDLVFLTRLLQLATGCRAMLRSRKYSFPPADPELLHTFYPVLTSCILEVQLRDEDDVSEAECKPLPNLVGLFARDEVVRHITQVFCLERLASNDISTAHSLLASMVEALDKMSDKAFPEFAPFAATLAQKLVKFVKSGQLAPGQPLWKLAVDQFLLRAVDTETQVHEEVLRLLLAVHSKLSVQQVADYLQTLLRNSRKSRRRAKRRRAEAEGLEEAAAMGGYETSGYGGYMSAGPSSSYFMGAFSDGRLLDRPERSKSSSDGVKYLYQDFVRHMQKDALNDSTAPELMQYLASG